LRRAVENLHIVHAGAPNGFVSISVGVAGIVPVHQDGAQALLEQADAALYAAKRNGRNRVTAHRELEMAQAS
jgi:two-component system, chemotaxis family, response regulator WspR